MFDWTDTQEFECDAPPYPIVEACETIGIRSPLDVRWCRISRSRLASGQASSLFGRLVRKLFHAQPPEAEITCFCRKPLPETECYRFTCSGEESVCYRIGQCPQCFTIFWDDA